MKLELTMEELNHAHMAVASAAKNCVTCVALEAKLFEAVQGEKGEGE